MLKQVLLVFICSTLINGLTIDNQLVSAKHDCFERIALGAMLPFEKTFRTTDTNSLRVCEDLCSIEGPKCQTYALGIHLRGNGTCQLSSEIIDSTRARPVGTIFDPDFDLYARRANCIMDGPGNNQETPRPGGLDNFPGSSTTSGSTRPSSQFPSSSRPTTPFEPPFPNRDRDRDPTSTTHITTDPSRPSTYPTNRIPSTGNRVQPTEEYPTRGSDRYPPRDRFPTTPTDQNYPSTSGDRLDGNRGHSYNFSPVRVPPHPDVGGGSYQEVYPTYQYPMLYEKHYPMPNDKDIFPNSYAQNSPSLNVDYHSPGRPSDFDYLNGDRTRYNYYDNKRPTSDSRPSGGYGQSSSASDGYGQKPSSGSGYGQSSGDKYPSQGSGDRYGQSSSNDRYGSSGGGYGQSSSSSGGYGESSLDKYPSSADRYGQSSSSGGSYGQSSSSGGGYGQSSSDKYPSSGGQGSYGQGSSDKYPSSADRYGQSSSSGDKYGQSAGGGYAQSSSDKYPSSGGGYGQGSSDKYPSSADRYGQSPSSGGGYGQSSSSGGGYGQSSSDKYPSSGGSYGQGSSDKYPSSADRYGQSSVDKYGQSSGDKYGQSSGGGYGQSSSDKYPSSGDKYGSGGGSGNGYGQSSSSGDKYGHTSSSSIGYGSGSSSSDSDSGYGQNVKPISGGYGVTEEPIEIYFNPNKPKPVEIPESGSYGSSLGPKPSEGDSISCFRRVLAGKKIATHWVRRTLACERVDDCQRECGQEKRFTCEGFNYRLDPTGHGQGICELLEIPLSQLDLYSSPHNRDSNLIRHPDYDYYERDRNAAPGCNQPTSCIDCDVLNKPIYRPTSAVDYFKPSYRPGDRYPDQFPDKYPGSTAIDKYRPPYESRPGYNSYEYSFSNANSNSNSYSSSGQSYQPSYSFKPSYGSDVDRYDNYRPSYESTRPVGYGEPQAVKPIESHYRPHIEDNYRPYYKPESYDRPRPSHHYLDRDTPSYQKPFIPYQIGQDSSWGVYGGSYGQSGYSKKGSNDYWGVKNDINRADRPQGFNYYELGGQRHHNVQQEENSIWNYGNKFGGDDKHKHNMGHQWTRRPVDECSVKSSEGFRLHKGVVRFAYNVPDVRECEKMCYSENKFNCLTYSYRYTNVPRENCLLCDRPFNLLDYYADLEPDRDFDIYSMSDDPKICREQSKEVRNNNAQCFFRAVDANRFFKAIVRDSLNVRSVGECELECIKTTKFTCRAFTYRYGSKTPGSVIDNCQLSDWPVREMDKERHLVPDISFDVFERASYGLGCEIQPIVDEKHNKLCYLGYGSPAKLLSSAIKKVISVPSELECKNECTRFRENTPFKCLAFSYGTQASTFNCEMSDLDQSELKVNLHYAHTQDRDFWLFAWNPFDWTCRDKVTTLGGGSRVNNDRRMDIFREPGEASWLHFTVTGKPCRIGTRCEKNVISGFYSCELEGAEVGAWDYCCRNDHPCGYSQGFKYPWCFVGDAPDQWRQCSDRYFPTKGTKGTKNTIRNPDKKKGDIYQQPPRPGGLQNLEDFGAARLWPVTFLYTDGPPNATELSNVIDCKKESC